MSIERTSSTQPVAATKEIQLTKSANKEVSQDTGHAEKVTAESPASQVTLSNVTNSIMNSSNDDLDMVKITRIQDAIRDGSLTLDAGKIADSLLNNISLFD